GALAAIERLDRLAASSTVAAERQASTVARLRAEYDERVEYYSRRLTPLTDPATAASADSTTTGTSGNGTTGLDDACTIGVNFRREALAAERQMIVRLRDQGVIGDEVLRVVQEDLD